MASADGAKWTKDNLGTQSADKSTILYRARELVPMNAPLDRSGESFNSGSYQHEIKHVHKTESGRKTRSGC